ncbi:MULTISPECIES: hypothetical protein [unclassified Mesorhizobium]|uniref:hypothetical protein n=1 Tax=unclassified Mesorhizobium TaxID=325217 RepID=UPI00333B230B
MAIHRTFAVVVFCEDDRLRHHGQVDMTRSGLEGFGRSLNRTDEVVVEATRNAMGVVRVLSPFVDRVMVHQYQSGWITQDTVGSRAPATSTRPWRPIHWPMF